MNPVLKTAIALIAGSLAGNLIIEVGNFITPNISGKLLTFLTYDFGHSDSSSSYLGFQTFTLLEVGTLSMTLFLSNLVSVWIFRNLAPVSTAIYMLILSLASSLIFFSMPMFIYGRIDLLLCVLMLFCTSGSLIGYFVFRKPMLKVAK